MVGNLEKIGVNLSNFVLAQNRLKLPQPQKTFIFHHHFRKIASLSSL